MTRSIVQLEVGDKGAVSRGKLNTSISGLDTDLATAEANIVALQASVAKKLFTTVGFEDADYICDGIADDVQINAAIQSLTSGGVLFIKQGLYALAATLNIDIAGITIAGESMYSVTLTQGANDNGFYITAANAAFRDFFLDCNDNGAQKSGIYKESAVDGLRVDRVKIMNAGFEGITITGGNNHIIRDCILDTCATADEASPVLPAAIGIHTASHFQITGCICRNTVNTAQRGGGIDASTCTDGFIAFNECYSNDYGIDFPYGLNMTITGNHCYSNNAIGIDMSNGGQQNVISNNYCYDNGIDGIRIWASNAAGANSQYCTVIGNICDSNGTGGSGSCAGIYISDAGTGSGASAQRIVISGNMCMDRTGAPNQTQKYGILSDNRTDWLMVTNNICYNNKTSNLTLAGANNTNANNQTA